MLIDTSVWVDHFRRGNDELKSALGRGEVLTHPFVTGELACGNLKRRLEILTLMAALPEAPTVDHHEALTFLDRRGLAGSGLGWIDVHLLASASLAGLRLWSLDRRLDGAAAQLGLGTSR